MHVSAKQETSKQTQIQKPFNNHWLELDLLSKEWFLQSGSSRSQNRMSSLLDKQSNWVIALPKNPFPSFKSQFPQPAQSVFFSPSIFLTIPFHFLLSPGTALGQIKIVTMKRSCWVERWCKHFPITFRWLRGKKNPSDIPLSSSRQLDGSGNRGARGPTCALLESHTRSKGRKRRPQTQSTRGGEWD